MSYTESVSETYTIADIAKVIDCFAADLDMTSQSTGLLTRDDVKTYSAAVKLIAQRGYLLEVNIVLHDATGEVIRAAKYEVVTDGSLMVVKRPGNNLWPRTPGGDLTVVIRNTQKWIILSETAKQAFKATLGISWGTSSTDLSFPTLTRKTDRSYASNTWGMNKSLYSNA